MTESNISLIFSFIAIIIASWSAHTQYLQRQDAIEERVKIELKMTFDKGLLSPADLRVLSGVNERKELKTAMLITNIGNAPVRIIEAGYQDLDMPEYASLPDPEKVLSPGERVLLPMPNLITINHQLTDNIKMGVDKNAKIFAVTTKGNRFDAPAIIEVAN
ncbi:hypothetical protein [Acinetobacter sp.]|uniref:hypothetical protein n=1 Tax=Acinetobacter sp. TaxID=472 RepID=UPI002588887F|nr:hypothetical protein [Acinetobacter sp.]